MSPIERNFLCKGKKGDLIMGLYVVKALGGGRIFITPGEFEEPLESVIESCGRLVHAQDYVTSFEIHDGQTIDINLDDFRKSRWLYRTTLLDVICRTHQLPSPKDVKPWINVPAHPDFAGKVVLHRRTSAVAERGNPLFDWDHLFDVVGRKNCVFVSRLKKEWEDFGHPEIDYYAPADMEEPARIIRASRLYIGNQSLPSALADALGVNRIFELSWGIDRKHFAVRYAENAWYFASPWDCTLKNFRYLCDGKHGQFLDLATGTSVASLEPYVFDWLKAFSNDMAYRLRLTRFGIKQQILCIARQ